MHVHDKHEIVCSRGPLNLLNGPAQLAAVPIIALFVKLDVAEIKAMVLGRAVERFVLSQLLTANKIVGRWLMRPRPRIAIAISAVRNTSCEDCSHGTKREHCVAHNKLSSGGDTAGWRPHAAGLFVRGHFYFGICRG